MVLAPVFFVVSMLVYQIYFYAFECRNEYRHYGGDHMIFIGHVERYAYTSRSTLLFGRGRYMRGEPLLPP